MLAYFDRWEIEPDRAILEGPAGRVDITSPLPGVLRLCLATPGLPRTKPPGPLRNPPVFVPLRWAGSPPGPPTRLARPGVGPRPDPSARLYPRPPAGGRGEAGDG